MTAKDPDPLDDLGTRFELDMLERHARSREGDLEALRALAYAYSEAGRHADALEVDLELVTRAPRSADLRYDLACSFALLGRPDEAIDALHRAFALGFDDRDHALEDPDLQSLRDDPRFHAIVHPRRSG